MKMRGNETGFTLIELIVVIVILGILAAIAIPRYADIQTEARIAKMHGALGAIRGAASIAHAAWLVRGGTGTTITMEGATVTIVNGYPDVNSTAASSGIYLATDGLADYNATATDTVFTLSPDTGHTACVITYTEPASAGAAPTYNSTALTTANCD